MARKAATNFYNWRMGRSVSPEQAHLTYVERIPSQQGASGFETSPVNAFYVFDFGGQFVMISADTRVMPILAFSTETGFSGDNVPENLRWFLDQYTQQIAYAIQHLSDAECEENVNVWNQWLSNEVPVMATTATENPLVQTSWSQEYPYNAQCPEDPSGLGGHVVTGCVATAMAQIIRYWQYPSHGIGSHSYSGNYGIQSVDFSAATYDYSLMPLSLNSSSPAAQINEVAKLMYHCGVSVDMIYGAGSSGATTHNAANALNSYFGYNGVIEIHRSSYTEENWIALLKGELDSLRPILYCGSGTIGHAFVCDGYDNSNNFHFNWGWGGSYDGYFTLSNLTPGGHNFNISQAAVVGIDASQPKIRAGVSSMTFLSEAGAVSASQSTTILTVHLSSGITATATGNFKISTDNTNFYTSRTLGINGGTLYVRHEPAATSGSEYGFVTLVSGSVQDTIYLKGILFDNTPHCLPPKNLNISSQDLHNISLHWDAPIIDPDPHTLSWSSQTYTTNLSIGNNYKVSLLQRFSNEDLVPYHNQALTSITFYARSGFSTLKVVAYQGGSYNGGYDAGTQVLSQNIPLSSLTMNAWNTITLSTPVVVDATQELWFGIYVESESTSLPVTYQETMPTKGCIMGTHNSELVSWSELSQTYSFCLLGTVKNAQTLTNYTISRNGSTLATTSSTTYTDHLTGTNTYHYTVTANWSNGCSASEQRSFTNVMSISASPEILSFYSNHGQGTLVKTVALGGIGLTSAINISVTGNFLVSTNGTAFATSATLPKTGGILYVKYTPASNNSEYETGLMTLTSGSLSTTISLIGQNYNECNPPQNLVISQSGNTVGLSWDNPAVPIITQQSLTWFESNDFIEFGSPNSSIQRYIVHRFDTNDLAPYHGKQLTAVSFIASSDVTTYRIVVYQGGRIRTATYLQSGTQVVNQNVNISSLAMGHWNTIPLNTPVTIDASQELWYGIYLESPVNTYPIYVSSPYVNKKGLISKTATASDNEWVEYLANSYYHYTYCFVLNATIEDAPLSLTNYQIDRNITTLGTTGNTFYDDSITYNGTYNYDVWAVWNNGCKAPVRGSITVRGLCDPAGQTYTQEACESYTWYGTPYNTSGTYHHSYIDGSDCPVLDTLVLTIHTGTHNVETKTACESYIWHGTTYTSSGTYQYYYDNAYGCASVDTLKLTINHGTHNVETHTACESYTWHGQTYTTSGTYTHPYTNGLGCPSTDTLHLTVNYGTHNVETHTACESYTWHGQTYTSSGTYTHPYTNANGCASTDTLHLIVNHGTHNVVTETACESFTWHGQTYTQSGTYTFAYTNGLGCPSTDTLHLIVNHGTHNVVTETACESFTWHGQTYTTSGTYTHPYTNANGCASTDTLHLTVNYGTHNVVTETACESFTWHGQTYTTSGIYTFAYNNAAGCPSVDTLHLTVNYGTHNVVTKNVCISFTWHGQTYTSSGTYTHSYTNAAGCPSVDTLKLTVNHTVTELVEATACEEYLWNGIAYSQSGEYTQTLTSTNGCDSVVTLHLTVHYGTHNVFSETACESFTWHGQTYTQSGTYTFAYNNTHGCASVDTLHLTVHYGTHNVENETACKSFTWHGHTYTQSGTYTFAYNNTYGCASVDTLHLTVHYGTHNAENETACESFTWHGQTYTQSGTYTYAYNNANDCASVDTLHLTVNYGTHNVENETACESFTWHGTTYTTSGTYTYAYNNADGCPSIDTLHLTVLYGTHNVENETACENFTWHGQSYTQSGTYTFAYTNADGCPSVDTLHLTVHYGTHNVENETTCESFTWHGHTYTQSGTYTFAYNNADGCASVDTLHLTVHYGTHNVLNETACESFSWHGTTYTTSGTYTYSYNNADGCASTDTLHLTVLYGTHNVESAIECESYTWHGQTYTTSGTYTYAYNNAVGCPSVDTLHLTVHPAYATDKYVTLCESELPYTYVDTVFGVGTPHLSTHITHYSTINGCDSMVTLHLTVNPTYSTAISANICQGESYNFLGNTFSETGVYNDTLQTVSGCDSIVILSLTVHPTYNNHIYETICQGESYYFCGQNLSTPGTYARTLETVSGCDSVVTLHLTVNSTFNTPVYASICQGNSYSFFGQALTTAGIYSHTFQSVKGCDSVVTLTLTVRPTPAPSITGNTTICQGQSTTLTAIGGNSYVWSNGATQSVISVGTGGIYTVSVTNIEGCSATANITVTVNPLPNVAIAGDHSICQGSSTTLAASGASTYAWSTSSGNTSITVSEAGSYSVTGTDGNGCSSTATHAVAVHPTYNTPVTAAICQDESYDFFGQPLTSAGTFTHTLQSVYGCDSVITLTLTVNPVYSTPIAHTMCQGESYNFLGATLTEAGTYVDTLQTVNGCDSVITLTLTVLNTNHTEFTDSACDTYEWNGETFTVSGDYTRHFSNVNGCDSSVTLHLTISNSNFIDFSDFACDEYTWNGVTYTASGDYTVTFTNAAGCDSTVTLHLTVNHSTTGLVEATTCDEYTWNGATYTTSGDYPMTFTNAAGCDSVVTLHLTVNHSVTELVEATACDDYTWNGATYTASGDYPVTFTTANGCDSVVTLRLTINPSYTVDVYDTAMREHEYVFGDFTFTPHDTGVYTHDFQYSTVEGCDSLVHLILLVQNNDGIPTNAIAGVEVFPNPTNHLLNIKGEDMRQISIYNADGQLVYSSESSVSDLKQVDVSRYAAGHYYVKVKLNDNRTVTLKFIVNRQ